jgi:G:T-mismatch repair DNA endonuclease (very short patch repair protein)
MASGILEPSVAQPPLPLQLFLPVQPLSLDLQARRKHGARRPASGFEKAVYAILKAEKIPFQKEKAVGRCHVDVYIEPNIIVELQGCFWHKHMCQRPKAGWTDADREVQRKDDARFAYFKSQGYEVVSIWECELERDPEWIRTLLKKLKS